ncbi:hypothetical protein K1719_038287 [Acacia pycnantha]|nr:hypothetical protein K1719_038287 [Acacia pycnantha]
MNDFDGLLASDFGFKRQGKSDPMAASKGSSNTTTSRSARNSINSSGNFMGGSESPFGLSGNQKKRDTTGFDDLFGSSARFPSKSQSLNADSSFNLDSMFHGSKSPNSPVYDKPVYDDDTFDGFPGLKSSSKVKYDNIFASASSAPPGAFDDLLDGFGKVERESKSSDRKRPGNNDSSVPDFNGRSVNQNAFDDLLGGFGGRSPPSDRPAPDIGLSSEPTARAFKTTPGMAEDPFKVFESTLAPLDSSSGQYMDPLEEISQISKLSSSSSMKNDSSVNSNGRVYDDDIDPFGGLGKSVPAFSSGTNNRKGGSPPHTNTSSNWTRDKETIERSSVRTPERQSQSRIPVDHNKEFQEMHFDIPSYSSDYDKPVNLRASSPSNNNVGFREANIKVNMSPKYEENSELNDIWLTVSEIPLFTQPTTAPPPSRPPPPRPASANAKKKAKEASFQSSTQFSQGPKSASAAAMASSQFDELDVFSMDRNRGNDDGHVNSLVNEELEMNSAAAAMKEAMDRAEAKFRHAKEVRERENIKASRSNLEKDETVMQEDSEKEERLNHERQRRERGERERRRLVEEKEREQKEREQQLEREREKAREIEREREKARQAVERATREARERAAAEARTRAERAAAEKASVEARERAAVQRAQAEARERAAAEAKERAERTATEARERANSESKEREARERAAAARAEAEARVRADRASVERAAAEARERAAAQVRERAAAAARMNQQKNENDLESFFSMGTRASSAPRPPRANSSDFVFDNQSQPDITMKSTGVASSMKKASSSTNIVDDLSSIFGSAPSTFGEFQEVEGESEERRRARVERHQRTQERAAKALAEKNQRDLQTQRDQAERHRIAETLDVEIKRWAAGKEGNLRALLSTLQYVLWPECGWQPVSLTDLITGASVKKVYRKATLCVHPDKVQQKGATLQQKYIAEKVFDLLKEAWNKFNSEELF